MKTKIFTLLMCFVTLVTVAQNDFQKAFKNNALGTQENMRIAFSDSLGNTGHLPISVIKGNTEGPVFTIAAGVHGCEYAPIMATQELLKEFNTDALAGTLIIIPIASMDSFLTRTPFKNKQDDTNLNGVFPGNENGTITEKMGYFITENIIPVSEVFLDIHSGDAPEDLLPFICYYDNPKKQEQTDLAKKLSEDSGFQYVVSYPYTIADTDRARYMFKQAVQDGKTSVSIEAGKLGTVQQENVTLIKQAVYNMLETMNMYHNASGGHNDIIYRNHQTYIKATATGIFYSTHKAGDQVKKDAVVGYTTDEFGMVIEEHHATEDGIILYMFGAPPVNAGETVMCISSYVEN